MVMQLGTHDVAVIGIDLVGKSYAWPS